MDIDQFIDELGYLDNPENWIDCRDNGFGAPPSFRLASLAGVRGAYCFQTSPQDERILPLRPAIYIAEANDEDEARQLHRKVWNIGDAPFLVIITPNHVRVYAGFDYDFDNPSRGLIVESPNTLVSVKSALSGFYASEIDEGRIWQRQSDHVVVDRRVDYRLLANLKALSDILVNTRNVKSDIAHALIGKYIYISFLIDRRIISKEWTDSVNVDLDEVLGIRASLNGLKALSEALETRFNGGIFPLALEGTSAPSDEIVSFVASVFRGDDAVSRQLSLNFRIYDFSFIPIELLSAIYEQFLHVQNRGASIGAYYTPEPVAEYLLCELNYSKPLAIGMKILDPCCGSGIFLVLTYRRLLEISLAERQTSTLDPNVARDILTESIYGIERNLEACYVAEFSLILTLLSYIDPPELHYNADFKFPRLHNQNIFEADFFDFGSMFYHQKRRFDWIVGNPPWIDANPKVTEDQCVLRAIGTLNKEGKIVAGNRVCDAFTWQVDGLLNPNGMVGLLIHATSLTNINSERYRRAFFHAHKVIRITNFSNLAYVLFAGRAEAPAATIIYVPSENQNSKSSIIHYGPFAVNQIPNTVPGAKRKPTWSITINEDEIQPISCDDAEKGDGSIWKIALWGSYRDKRYLDRLSMLFPYTLGSLSKDRGWSLSEGVQLRSVSPDGALISSGIVFEPRLRELPLLDTDALSDRGFRFGIPDVFLSQIPDQECYVRKRGGLGSLKGAYHPHLYINTGRAAYSDADFVVRNPQIYLAAPEQDAEYLRALSALLNSSVMTYLLFFRSAAWGIGRTKLGLAAVKNIPIPNLTIDQILSLSTIHREVEAAEKKQYESIISNELSLQYTENETVDSGYQAILDDKVEEVLNLPKYAAMVAREFVQVRLQLNKGKVGTTAIQYPSADSLNQYALVLRDELDAFTNDSLKHRVVFNILSDLIVCSVEMSHATQPIEPNVSDLRSESYSIMQDLWYTLRQQFNQWVYVQRGLRVFEGQKVTIYKTPRLIDWTRSKALQDADDIIAEVLSRA